MEKKIPPIDISSPQPDVLERDRLIQGRKRPTDARPQAALATFPLGSDSHAVRKKPDQKDKAGALDMETGKFRSRNNALILLTLFLQPHTVQFICL